MKIRASFDEVRRRMTGIAALRRLLTEQRKTRKRVNALKYNVIPRYQATIRYIESALSEDERNMLFQLKVMREQAEPVEGGR